MSWNEMFDIGFCDFQTSQAPILQQGVYQVFLYIGRCEKAALMDAVSHMTLIKDDRYKPTGCNAMYAGVKVIYVDLETHFKFTF